MIYYVALLITSILIDCAIWHLSGVMIGVGHGPSFPFVSVCGPFYIYLFSWPVLVVAANLHVRQIRMVSKTATIAYYAWLGYHWDDVLNMFAFFSAHIFDAAWIIFMWAVLFSFLHCLIWLPAIICKHQVTYGWLRDHYRKGPKGQSERAKGSVLEL
jgi:hypothetical protein